MVLNMDNTKVMLVISRQEWSNFQKNALSLKFNDVD